jgi:DUF1365 family protein
VDGVSFEPRIAFGRVLHQRLRPVRHGFTYPVFFVRVPLSRLGSLATRWLSVDRWNLLSLMRRDFGPRDGSDLEAWIRGVLERQGVTEADGEIVLQAFPRVMGFVFNPIAFWHCHDRRGGLRAVLCEVSNTFGERHNYLLAHDDGRPIGPGDWMTAAKALHVSPFCEVAGHYRFRFPGSERYPMARIDYHDRRGLLLATALHGRGHALNDRRVLEAVVAYPFMTLRVVARIHWQALRLWASRVPYFPKPAAPTEETTR